MKKTLKLIFFFVIIFIAITMSKTVNAAEENMAEVEYNENTDGTVKVTMTFSENVEEFTKLENSGWTLSGKTATKNMNPGEWYIYTSDEENAESGVVAVPNQVKVNETLTLNDSSDIKLGDLKIDDPSLGTVDGKKIKFIKEGKTNYSTTATMKYTSSSTNKTITKKFDLVWDVTISNNGNDPVNPTNKTATVTYGEPTDAGVLVTVKFSQNIPDTKEVKEKLSDWQISGDTATRTMAQGAIASIIIKYEDGSKENAKVAVPVTLEIGSQIDFSGMAKDLKIDNTEIATVESGIVKAKAKGTTKMTGTSLKDGNEYTWTINVNVTDNGNNNENNNNENNNSNSGNNNGESNEKNNNDVSGNTDKSIKGNDGTTANKKLAQTGYASMLPVGIILISFAVISFIKYKKSNK